MADDFRTFMFEQFRQTASNPQRAKSAVRALQRMGFNLEEVGKIEEFYAPLVPSFTKEDIATVGKAWMAEIEGGPRTYGKMMEGAPGRQVSKSLLPRRGMMLPDEKHLEDLGIMTPQLQRVFQIADERHMTSLAARGSEPVPIRRHTLDLIESYRHYTRGMAKTQAWNIPIEDTGVTLTDALQRVLPEVKRYDPSGVKMAMLRDTYIPLYTGQLTWSQAVPSMSFAGMRLRAAEKLQASALPERIKEWGTDLLKDTSRFSFHRLGAQVSDYFFTTTLAFNTLAPAVNLTQAINNTATLVGPKYAVRGAKEVFTRMKRMSTLIHEQGLTAEQAFEKSFGEFSAAQLDVGTHAPMRSLGKFGAYEGEAGEVRLPSRASKWTDTFKNVGLWLFSKTENINRLHAFYAGRAKFVDEAVGMAWTDNVSGQVTKLARGTPIMNLAANEFGRDLTFMTQFGGGALSLPYGIVKWWAPMRQYMQYPLRQLGVVLGPALSAGAAEGTWFRPGMLGRMLLTSGLLYGAGKEFLGTDLSGTMFTGGIPIPGENKGPYGIVPLVPPLMQAVGGVAAGVFQGDLEQFKRTIPLLIPGGIEAARLSSTFAPPVAKTLGRTFVDYSTRTEDGKVALRNEEGSVLGYYTPLQMWAKAFGFQPAGVMEEAALVKYLLAQRERMRAIRQDAIDAALRADTTGFDAAQAQWAKLYPGMGPITIKKSDLKAAAMRREIPRLERILKTLPAQSREEFAAIISAVMGVEATRAVAPGNARLSAPQRGASTPTPNAGMGRWPSGIHVTPILQGAQEARKEMSNTAFASFESY